MILRPRQETFVQRCRAALHDHGNTLGIAPTGAGKTVMLSAVAGNFIKENKGAKAIILQHRDELVAQNRQTFHDINGPDIASGEISAIRKDFLRPVAFAMVQTLCNDANLKAMQPTDLLVIDEAHHTAAKSYQKIIDRARALRPDMKLLGLTATPNRGDKKGLIGSFDNVCDQIMIGELIASGHLVRPRTFVIDVGVKDELKKVKRSIGDFNMEEVAAIMDKGALNETIIERWKEQAGDRQTVVFCSTVLHAQHVLGAFLSAGVSAKMVTGEMVKADRRKAIKDFDQGEFQVMVNVAVLTEGWDCQPVSCVVLLRPCSYASTMIQMIGRGLRRMDPERYPGRPPKNDCIVLDFGTSVLTHGSLEQTVDLDPYKSQGEKKVCPGCQSSVPVGVRECAICGYVFDAQAEEADPEAEKFTGGTESDFVLTEVDLFKQSPFQWENLWDETVLVATAFDAWAMAIFYQGQWCGLGGAKGTGIKVLSVGDKMLCLSTCDDFMRTHGDSTTAAKSRKWLHLPPSAGQLKHLRIDPATAQTLTRYQAACHLTWQFNERGIRAKLEGHSWSIAA